MSNEDEKTFNDVCPVCLNEEEDMIILSCLHRLHGTCAEGLTNLNCPICRENVVNWPPQLRERIVANSSERAREIVEEETEELQRQEQEQRQHFRMFLQPPPQIEVASAIQYLSENGIPLQYIPQSVNIARSRNQPRPAPGVLFSTIVGQALERVSEDLRSGNLRTSRSVDEEESSSSSEDPFEQENEEYATIDREINFVEVEDESD